MVGACGTIGACMAALPAVESLAQLAPVLAGMSLGVSAMATVPTARVVDHAPLRLRSQVCVCVCVCVFAALL
jgi:hypothetical protein